jgi:hypothetical protein
MNGMSDNQTPAPKDKKVTERIVDRQKNALKREVAYQGAGLERGFFSWLRRLLGLRR